MIAHMVAASENNVIGRNNDLPWSIPEDTKWFRERTKGRALIMGRKTFQSLGHPLPHRLNVVVTRDLNFEKSLPAFPEHSPVKVFSEISTALEYCREIANRYQNEIFIIGGGEIYKQSMNFVDTIFLTRVHADVQGDIYYPQIPGDLFELAKEDHRKGDPAFSFLEYRRKAKS